MSGLGSGKSFIISEFGTPTAFKNLTITANGAYTFNYKYTDGYDIFVQILTQPSGQTCAFDDTNAAGATINGSDITNVDITCAP